MLTLAIIIGSLLILVFVYFAYSPFNYWKDKNVPHPPVSYLFGNIGDVILLKKSFGQVFDDIYRKYPNLPYVGFYRMRTPCVLIRDPELIQDITVKNFNSFRDNDIFVDEENDPYFARNPFVAKGQKWKESRAQSTPSFTPKRIKEMYPLMNGVAQKMVEYINDNVVGVPEGVDAKELCQKYSTDAVANCALGVEANSFVDPNSEYIKMIKRIISPSIIKNIKFVLIAVVPSLAKILKAKVIPDDAAAYYKNVVSKTLEYRIKSSVHRGDFLDGMSELQKKLGKDNFTIDDITGHALSFFTDGTETSAIILSFTLYELGLHNDIQAELKNEIDEIMHKHEGKLNYEAIQDMEYLDMVVNESMRKNMPVSMFSRICTEKYVFTIGEAVTIDPGTPIIFPIQGIHHDPKYYPNPSLYDPTRFSADNISNRPKCTFLTFGEGPRGCLGQRFGIGQVKVAIVHLVKNFEISVNKATTVPYEIDPHYFLLAAKNGIRLDFKKRNTI